MKGQISIDYYAAVIIFAIIAIYFVFQISNIVPRFIAQMEGERMRSESYQISEILVNDAGLPNSWDTLVNSNPSQIQRLGFSDHSVNDANLVSSSKVDAFSTLCSAQGQEFVRTLVNSEFQFSIIVTDRDSDAVEASCLGPSTDAEGKPVGRGFVATTTRVFAFDDGRVGDLTVQVWKP